MIGNVFNLNSLRSAATGVTTLCAASSGTGNGGKTTSVSSMLGLKDFGGKHAHCRENAFVYRKMFDPAQHTHPLISTAIRRFTSIGKEITDITVLDGDSLERNRPLLRLIYAVRSLDPQSRFDQICMHMQLIGDEMHEGLSGMSAVLMAGREMNDFPAFGTYRFYIGEECPVTAVFRNPDLDKTGAFYEIAKKSFARTDFSMANEVLFGNKSQTPPDSITLAQTMSALLLYETDVGERQKDIDRMWSRVAELTA